jgi:hypothetical protein
MIKQRTYLAYVACFALGLFLTSSAKAEFVAWNWGSGANADSFTIEIASPTEGVNNSILSDLPLPTVDVFPLTVPEPSTWAMMLVGFAGLSYAARRRKGVVRGISV